MLQNKTLEELKEARKTAIGEALGDFDKDAIPRLLAISGTSSPANKYVKQAANSEIDKIKRGLKP